ncbi:ABC transporter, ATP-binding protein [Peptostreptococcaceae bacterium AS15]|nr:ABC transporter, ATP-binding protein [Peptostreptococcaceae bacterium AS15]
MLKIDNVNLSFKNFSLKNISISLDDNDTLVILGKSGSGKTLLLETIAGKYEHAGSIILNDKALHKVKACERKVSLVYQNFALFPFLNVFENIIFASKIKKIDKNIYTKKAEYLLERLGITHLKQSPIHKLSGGEKQRISLARALMRKSDILLLDEPLSALDYISKDSAKKLIKDLILEYKIMTILVTHDLEECEYFADKVAFMKNGSISRIIDINSYKKMKREEVLNEYI